MNHPTRLMVAAGTAFALSATAAFAQSSSPMPTTGPSTMPSTMPSSMPSTMPSTRPSTTPSTMPSTTPSTTPSTNPSTNPSTQPSAQPSATPRGRGNPGENTPHGNNGEHGEGNRGRHLGQLKHIRLPQQSLRYALGHQREAADKLKAMKTIDLSKLTIVSLSQGTTQLIGGQRSTNTGSTNTSGSNTQSGSGQMSGSSAGTTQTGSSNSPSGGSVTTGAGGISLNNSQIQYLHNVLANVNVSDALNNVTVSLSNVLNNNNISIGQVLGIYIGGGGAVTAITK